MNSERLKYEHNGQLIYEWEQTIDEVHVYFYPPKWALSKYREENMKTYGPTYKVPKMLVKIESKHLQICIEGQQPFIDVR